ncbi:putative secreted protein with PEP-CTERM sorting signal [Pseudoduganella flava]|uniref:Putative secreted protein with PEP-CTERM sorting signal n=1 Tax=Pseudoduganella flava TaxID=871742 RepID=A0A562Q0C5_9BURK|nr:PEP-CTERM sorting domain-containing protein [Pseudoduganella flava]QGZ38640.1 hypothetical protein GO485_05940 [Pseudoduganella flava]TWI49786.1 putative secreted protein with PEP-CTERM sorting signal [Pseudoduganella flava]
MTIRTTAALVLALGAASPSTAARYDFSYSGFYFDSGWNDALDGFDTSRYLGGFFVADDLNGNGSFELAELTNFAYTLASNLPDAYMTHLVGPQVPDYCLRCEVQSFAYTPGGTLAFHAVSQGVRLDETITNTYFYTVFYDSYWSQTVTPQTVISVTPVPEPGAALMFTAGLAGLACMRKWKAART